MRDINSALGHQLYQVPGAKFVSDVPSDADNDDCAIEVATTKHGRHVRLKLIHATDYRLLFPFAPQPSPNTLTFKTFLTKRAWTVPAACSVGGRVRVRLTTR